MKSKYQEIIGEYVKLIIRNIVMALLVSPFVIVFGYVFYIHLLKEGFSLTTSNAFLLLLGTLLIEFINLNSIAKDLKSIKEYKFLKEQAEY
jgi:hypothetical protein